MWVSAWCLSSETRSVSNRTQRDCGGDKSTSQFIKMLTWESQLRVEGSRVHGVRTNFQPISTLMRKLLPVGCIRYSLRMGFKTLSFFCPVLGGPPGEAGSAPLRSRRQVWCLLSAAIRLLGITRGVSFRVRGQSSPHRAKQRLSPGRARDHPDMEIVPNKALSLSLSLSPRRVTPQALDFGVFAFLSFSLGQAGDCLCRHYVRGESWLP